MEHVLCAMSILFIRIEIRALDLIHLNIYIWNAIWGRFHQTKAIDRRASDTYGHKEELPNNVK